MGHEVVVGVAGTLSSEGALRWAAQAAAERSAELVLVHATGRPAPGMDVAWDGMLESDISAMLDREVDQVRAAHPTLKVRAEVDLDTPARCLVRRSATARLVVVGTWRTTAAERVFSGSLAYQVVAGAHCSVACVPPPSGPRAPRVVVGADGSAHGVAAVQAGAEEADRHGAVLEVVHAWLEPVVVAPLAWDPPNLTDATRAAEALVLAEAVAGLGERYPDLVVERSLVHAQPASALLDAAARAALVVVGSRGLHGVARVLLGSTSHAVVLHAPCPVLVVRA